MNPQTLNLYSYVLNNPLRLTDPSGNVFQDRYPGLCGPGCQGQDPKKDNLPPARKEGDPFPVADCLGCGSPFGKIAIVTINIEPVGDAPVSTSEPVLATMPTLPSSGWDYVPAAGPAREFLFNYTTHNFEGATVSFIALAVDLSPLGSVKRGYKLTTLGLKNAPEGIRVSKAGLAIVERHLAQFGEDTANRLMMDRIKAAHQYGLEIFGTYKNFYMHELYESTLMKKGLEYEVSHARALSRYGVREWHLYHRKVVEYVHKTEQGFGPAFLEFCGIK